MAYFRGRPPLFFALGIVVGASAIVMGRLAFSEILGAWVVRSDRRRAMREREIRALE